MLYNTPEIEFRSKINFDGLEFCSIFVAENNTKQQ